MGASGSAIVMTITYKSSYIIYVFMPKLAVPRLKLWVQNHCCHAQVQAQAKPHLGLQGGVRSTPQGGAPEASCSTTKQKLKLARYPNELEDVDEEDWSHGSKVAEVKRLAEYWENGFDWRAQEAIINSTFKQYKVLIDVPSYGPQLIHFAHHPSSSPTAIPLLFVGGWPGSFLEAQKLIRPLTDPPSTSDPAFHFIVASLPGFGPGDAPTKSPFGPLLAAHAFKILMVDILGYKKFVTQGGDFGSLVTRNMAMLYPQHILACHSNLMFCGPPPVYKNPLVFGRLVLNKFLYSSKEQQALVEAQAFYKSKIGYVQIQSTRPQSLGFGLGDSPVGLLGWFLEKYHDWMDLTHYKPSDDEILTFVMMHWMQGATPGLRYYKAVAEEKGKIAGLKSFQTYCSTPTGYSQFPGEAISPPLDWITACTNLCWTKEHDRGGHFAAVEQPELLIQDLREWFGGKAVRQAMA